MSQSIPAAVPGKAEVILPTAAGPLRLLNRERAILQFNRRVLAQALREDVPLLAQKFLHDISEEYGDARKVILPEAMKALQAMPWTGNVRELRNVIERLVIMCGDEITADEVSTYANFGQ